MTLPDLDTAAAAVFSWLLTYAIHSTLLLAAAALAAWRLADRHAWLDPIWKGALIAPLLTASLDLEAIALPVGGRWAMPAASIATSEPFDVRTPSAPVASGFSRKNDASPRLPPEGGSHERMKFTGSLIPDSGSLVPTAALSRWPLIGVVAWLMISGVALLRYVLQLRRLNRALGTRSQASAPALLDALDRLRTDAAEPRPVRLTTSALCRVPVALGGRHIVLPPRFVEELDPDQQRAALAHELAHVVRRDPEWRIAIDVLERALFFQPLNRVARARLSDSAEFLCDEWAVRCTQSPLALARCLSVVASWWTPDDRLPAGVSAMARSDSAMVRRVTRILETPAPIRSPRLHWLAVPVILVAVAAPRVTATQLPATAYAAPRVDAVLGLPNQEKAAERSDVSPDWSAARIASARAQLRAYRFDRPGSRLEERWQQALTDAGRQGLGDFWIVYTFTTPTHADGLLLSDTRNGTSISSSGRLSTGGPPLTDLIGPLAVPLEGGKLAVLLHYRAARPDGIDRAGYRSVGLGFDFGRTPVYWLGDALEAQSFESVRSRFGQVRDRKIQVLLIELASLHADSNAVIPFLSRLVEPSWPPEIRSEAAEGFDHHHDPRSVEILLRVARTDPDAGVRAEAAETIGEVQTPQAVPALIDLAGESPDPEVRREAAEGFGSQPAERALPAIEKVIATIGHDDVVSEAIEAIGELGDPRALAVLVQIANTHPNRRAQLEAVETLGDLDAAGVVDALTRLVWEHAEVEIQREAVDTLGDRRDDAGATAALERVAREHEREEVQAEAIETIVDAGESSLHPVLLDLAISGRSARLRREALDSIGEAVARIGDPLLLDRAQSVVERAIFDDPDRSVRADALDALAAFPTDRVRRTLDDVIARHPDPRTRRDAQEHLRERK